MLTMVSSASKILEHNITNIVSNSAYSALGCYITEALKVCLKKLYRSKV